MKDYYKNQLEKLGNAGYTFKQIKIITPTGEDTNWLNINLESIPEIIKFLKSEEKRLKSNQ